MRKAKLTFAHTFPRMYRAISNGLLYLGGPRPKRDLDRESFPVFRHQSTTDLTHRPLIDSGIYSTESFPVIDSALQSSNMVAPLRTEMDSIRTVLHPPAPLHSGCRRVHHQSRTPHSSTVVSNAFRHTHRTYRHILASQQRMWFGWK